MDRPPGLDVTVETADSPALRVRLAGELDLVSSVRLDAILRRVIADMRGRRVTLDLTDLTFMDSTGLRALWSLRQEVQEHGGTLMLESPSPAVMRVLLTTKLDKVFQIVDRAEPLP